MKQFNDQISSEELKKTKKQVHSAEVSKLAVVPLSPRENLSVHSQSHGVAPPGVHSDLLHHVVAECSDLARDWDRSTRQAQAQPAVGGLSTGVDLPLDGHCNNDTIIRHIHADTWFLFVYTDIPPPPAKRLLDPPATWTTLSADRVSEKEGTLICEGRRQN